VSITVYTRPDCIQCTYTKRELDKHGVAYSEVELTDELADQFREQGMTNAPVVVTDTEKWCGFRIDKLRGQRSKVQA
jgi:glutaredoxin-like protein NrdH